jgi:hypothetical protein
MRLVRGLHECLPPFLCAALVPPIREKRYGGGLSSDAERNKICGIPRSHDQRDPQMASSRQRTAARRNIRKAAATARRKKTISKLPGRTRTALGKQGAKMAKRKRKT